MTLSEQGFERFFGDMDVARGSFDENFHFKDILSEWIYTFIIPHLPAKHNVGRPFQAIICLTLTGGFAKIMLSDPEGAKFEKSVFKHGVLGLKLPGTSRPDQKEGAFSL